MGCELKQTKNLGMVEDKETECRGHSYTLSFEFIIEFRPGGSEF